MQKGLQISWIFQNLPNFCILDENKLTKKQKKSESSIVRHPVFIVKVQFVFRSMSFVLMTADDRTANNIFTITEWELALHCTAPAQSGHHSQFI